MEDSVKRYRQRRDERIKKRMDADFREGDHPRDKNGRFASGGGGKGKVIKSKSVSWPEENAPMGSWEKSRGKKKGPPKYTNEPTNFWG